MRICDITGVMPEPPEIISSSLLVGVAGLSLSVNSPCAWLRCRIWPGCASHTRNLLTRCCPGFSSWWARTVMENCSPGLDSAEEIEKHRVVRRAPLISTPTWTYCPARCPRQVVVGCMVMVATGFSPDVSRVMSTTRARTSVAAHIGLICSR